MLYARLSIRQIYTKRKETISLTHNTNSIRTRTACAYLLLPSVGEVAAPAAAAAAQLYISHIYTKHNVLSFASRALRYAVLYGQEAIHCMNANRVSSRSNSSFMLIIIARPSTRDEKHFFDHLRAGYVVEGRRRRRRRSGSYKVDSKPLLLTIKLLVVWQLLAI